MPFTHHSHSGQFCNHAKDHLAQVLQEALRKKMSLFCMTEHIPRGDKHLYPGEDETEESQKIVFDSYVKEAAKLRYDLVNSQKHVAEKDKCEILIGFESEWIQKDESIRLVNEVLSKYDFDFSVGSVHHVHTIPIDFDREHYLKARAICGENDEAIFHAYYDGQYEMLQNLQPKVVGHFDLIRLFSDSPDRDWASYDPSIWTKIIRNLRYVKETNSVLEINSSALRKGMKQPYPSNEICRAFRDMGGDFVMSDDSHGVEHIGTNYSRVLSFLEDIGLDRIAYLQKEAGILKVSKMPLDELKRQPFWAASKT